MGHGGAGGATETVCETGELRTPQSCHPHPNSLSLPPSFPQGSMTEVTEDTQLLSQVLEAVGSGQGLEETLARVTPQVFARGEVQLIKAAVGNGELQVCVWFCVISVLTLILTLLIY